MRRQFIYRCLICICSCFSAVQLHAQNQPGYEQYHFNQLVINPAYAGSNGVLDIQTFFRRQWTDMDGAPKTESIAISTAVGDGKHGLGFSVVHDNVAVSDKLQLHLDYAFRMYMGDGVLALGVSAQAIYTHLNYGQLDAFQNGDPTFINAPENNIAPNAGFGIWYSNKNMFTGFSVPLLIEKKDIAAVGLDDSSMDFQDATRHYFYTLGFLFPVSENVSLKPYTLIKYSYGAPVQLDASMSVIFYDFLWAGGSYRTDNSVTLMLEYFLKKNTTIQDRALGFGYAYNFRTDKTNTFFGPTHEFFISFNLDTHNTKFANPRFF